MQESLYPSTDPGDFSLASIPAAAVEELYEDPKELDELQEEVMSLLDKADALHPLEAHNTTDHIRICHVAVEFDGSKFESMSRDFTFAKHRLDALLAKSKGKPTRDRLRDITGFAHGFPHTPLNPPKAYVDLPAIPIFNDTDILYLLCPRYVNTLPEVIGNVAFDLDTLQVDLDEYAEELNRYPETQTQLLL